jgi:hypothetical protein
MEDDDAIVRLARQIDAMRRAERFREEGGEIPKLRRQGASELHRICADFVSSVNDKLSESLLELSPPTYSEEFFREAGANLMQISSQGRQMQISFEAPAQLISTEKFLVPYILEGEVRTFNQAMLDRFEVRSRLIFFCVDNETTRWRFYDWRTASSGIVDQGMLAGLMNPLF